MERGLTENGDEALNSVEFAANSVTEDFSERGSLRFLTGGVGAALGAFWMEIPTELIILKHGVVMVNSDLVVLPYIAIMAFIGGVVGAMVGTSTFIESEKKQ